MNPFATEILNAKEGDPAIKKKLDWSVIGGQVDDFSTTPATITTNTGAGITTPQIAGYCPTDGDNVAILSARGTRVVLGQVGGNGQVILRRASNQSATGSANTTISWDTEDLDIGGWWTSGTDITVPIGYGGVYAIHCRADGAATWTSASQTVILSAGVPVGNGHANGQIDPLPANAVLRLTAGTVISARVFNAGSTQNMTAVIGIHRVG